MFSAMMIMMMMAIYNDDGDDDDGDDDDYGDEKEDFHCSQDVLHCINFTCIVLLDDNDCDDLLHSLKKS